MSTNDNMYKKKGIRVCLIEDPCHECLESVKIGMYCQKFVKVIVLQGTS